MSYVEECFHPLPFVPIWICEMSIIFFTRYLFTVLSYVEESDMDFAREIQEVLCDRSKSFDLIFSRNKMLRRRIKQKTDVIAREQSCS